MSITVKAFSNQDMEHINAIIEKDYLLKCYVNSLKGVIKGEHELVVLAKKKIRELIDDNRVTQKED